MATFYLRINYETSANITLDDKYSVLANWSMDADGNTPATALPTSSDDIVIKIYGSAQRSTITEVRLVTMTHNNITIDASSVVNTLTNASSLRLNATNANTLVAATNSFTSISYVRNNTESRNTGLFGSSGSLFKFIALAIISPNISLTNFFCNGNNATPKATDSITLNGFSYVVNNTITTSLITLNDNSVMTSNTITGNLLVNSSYPDGDTSSSYVVTNTVNGNVTLSSGIDRTIGGTISGNLTMQGSTYSTANNNGRLPITGTVSGTTQFTSLSPVTFTIGSSTVWNISPNWIFTTPNPNFIFQNSSQNDGTIPGLAQFNDSSSNNGTVTLSASFNDDSYNRGVVSGVATYDGFTGSNDFGQFLSGESLTLISILITVTNKAIFTGLSANFGTITGSGEFSNKSFNDGVITGDATFRGQSYNRADIGGAFILAYEKGINGSSILGII